jgi:hypothetical protein
MYSVLKRGLFLIIRAEVTPLHSAWEVFMRSPPQGLRNLAWNTDNYFVGVVASLVLTTSVCAMLVGLANGHYLLFCTLAVLYAIPIWAGLKLRELERFVVSACRRCPQGSQSGG